MTAEECDAFEAEMERNILPGADGARLLARAAREIARRHLSVVED